MEKMGLIPLIFIFLLLMGVVCTFLIFLMRQAFISNTEGALVRLQAEIEKTNAKQIELSSKIKEADEELEKRRQEARQLADKMRSDAEEQTKQEREKIIKEARLAGEEIISKAQNASQKLRVELEKQIDMKAVEFAVQIVNASMGDKVKGALDEALVQDFLDSLESTDLSKIDSAIKEIEVVTVNPLSEQAKGKMNKIFQEKIGRTLIIKNSTDRNIGGGVIVKFGTMALDGSIKNILQEKAKDFQAQVEARVG